MAETIGPGSLKCVVVRSSVRPLREALTAALSEHLSPSDIRPLGNDALLVYAEASTAAIRDWLAAALENGESVFVCEFERWSARGAEIDRGWLRARGH